MRSNSREASGADATTACILAGSFLLLALFTRPIAAGSSGPRLKLAVEAEGFYQVSGAELQAAGFDLGSVDPRKLRLLEAGREVAIRVVGEGDGVLDPTDTVELFGRGIESEFTRRNVYVLEQGRAAGRRMSERDVTPSGGAPAQTTHPATVHAEDGNAEYWPAMPDGDGRDHYFWQRVSSPSETPFTVTLPDLTWSAEASPAETAVVRVALHGRTDPPQDPDHHTRVLVNGHAVDDWRWDGQVPFQHTASFPQSLLVPGGNTVSVELVADTGAAVDSLYLNFIEIDYTADLVAVADELRFVGDPIGATEYRLSGFTEPAIELYDVTDPLDVARLVGAAGNERPMSGELAFEDEGSTPREYLALAATAKRSPAAIELDVPSSLRSVGNGADYLVISHPDFLASMTPLVELRAAQGLRTFAVDVTDVYDEFSFGVFDPTAIRDFIRYAYDSWQSPAPAFVVLVGDANLDYLDHLGTGTPNFLPTHLFETRLHGQFPEDNFYAAVRGDDVLPDVAIGRIPVRTPSQAAAVVAKIVSYEAIGPGAAWNQRILRVADGAPGFAAAQEAQSEPFLPSFFTAASVYRDDFPSAAAARAALLAESDRGAVLASYLGHGSVEIWGREKLLAAADVSSFASSGKYPFVITLDCVNGHYPHPSIPYSLAETLLNAEGSGAVAVWSPTGLGSLSEYVSLGNRLWENLLVKGETRVGVATVDAVKAAFGSSGISNDTVRSLVLFGDPATRLALNRDRDAVLDRDDNCPTAFNPAQEDRDGDGVGDACDPDHAVQAQLSRAERHE